MKRKTLKFIACAATMALTLSVTACGGSDDNTVGTVGVEDADDVEEVEEPEVEDGTEVEEDADVDADTDDEADTESDVDDEIEDIEDDTDAVIEDAEEELEDDSEEYQTLEDYFNNPDVKSLFESLIDAMGAEGLSISYEVSDNDFLMIFQITDSSMIVDGLAEGLAAELDNQAGQFKTQAAQFDSAVGEEGACTVTVRYTDPDDNVLAEQTYTAD